MESGKTGVTVVQDPNAKTDMWFSAQNKLKRKLFKELIERQFEDYSSRFDIIDMHPIAADYTDRNQLTCFFILKPKAGATTRALMIET